MKCDIWVDLKVVRIGQMEPKLGRVQCPMASGTEAWGILVQWSVFGFGCSVGYVKGNRK